jgi:hypothetical protein
MALQAQSPNIGQIALAATLCYRSNVVGIPKARSPQILEAPVAKHAHPSRRPEPLDATPLGNRIQSTGGADSFVALENLAPEVSRISAQTPFVNAPIRAEGPSPDGNLQVAPAAQDSATSSERQACSLRAPATHRAIAA